MLLKFSKSKRGFINHVNDFYSFLFLANAIDPRETTWLYMNYIYVEKDGKTAVVTDGRRLHVATLADKYKPGFYEVIKKNASQIWIYLLPTAEVKKKEMEMPDWKKLANKKFESLLQRVMAFKKDDSYFYATVCEIVKASGANYNFKYLSDIFCTDESGWSVSSCVEPKSKCMILRLEQENRFAILMPITS